MSRLLLYRLRRKSNKNQICMICELHVMSEVHEGDTAYYFHTTHELIICQHCNACRHIEHIYKTQHLTGMTNIVNLIEYCGKYDLIDILYTIKLYMPYKIVTLGKRIFIKYKSEINGFLYNPSESLLKSTCSNRSINLCRALCYMDIGFSKYLVPAFASSVIIFEKPVENILRMFLIGKKYHSELEKELVYNYGIEPAFVRSHLSNLFKR